MLCVSETWSFLRYSTIWLKIYFVINNENVIKINFEGLLDTLVGCRSCRVSSSNPAPHWSWSPGTRSCNENLIWYPFIQESWVMRTRLVGKCQYWIKINLWANDQVFFFNIKMRWKCCVRGGDCDLCACTQKQFQCPGWCQH